MGPEEQHHGRANTEQETVLQRPEPDKPSLPRPWVLHLDVSVTGAVQKPHPVVMNLACLWDNLDK